MSDLRSDRYGYPNLRKQDRQNFADEILSEPVARMPRVNDGW